MNIFGLRYLLERVCGYGFHLEIIEGKNVVNRILPKYRMKVCLFVGFMN